MRHRAFPVCFMTLLWQIPMFCIRVNIIMLIQEITNTWTLYHGSSSPQLIGPIRMNERDAGWYGKGFYLSASPEYASRWGPYIHKMAVPSNLKFAFVKNTGGYTRIDFLGDAEKANQAAGGTNAWIEDEHGWAQIFNTALRQMGYQGVRVAFDDYQDAEVVVFDPSVIHSLGLVNQPPVTETINPDIATFKSFADIVKTQYGLHQFDLWLDRSGDLKLNSLVVPRKDQKTGLGTAAMLALCRFADQQGKRIVLSPATRDDHWGTTSRSRLVAFYKRFGFVANSGRKKDFAISDGMYRDPKIYS